MREYDLIADWYSKGSDREAGVPEAKALAESLPPNAFVLDIGCGTGLPLTQVLLDAGCRVVGLDSSPKMLAHFAVNHPTTAVIQGTIQSPCFSESVFDAALAWGIIFHLPLEDQKNAFANVSSMLKPGAPFLFTAGDLEGNVTGEMDGVTFHYWSFSVEGYRQLLLQYGFVLEQVHADKGDNKYYLARKLGTAVGK